MLFLLCQTLNCIIMLFDENAATNVIINSVREFAEKRYVWQRHIQLLGSSLFGILISLHGIGAQQYPAYRLVFALAVVLLALGILLISLALYGHVNAVGRTHKALLDEVQKAGKEFRDIRGVSVPSRPLFVVCEWSAYICFGMSVLLLAFYVTLISV
ncbi:MAG: hypothetical protein ACOCWM_03030 [Cyclobacteriaceae bacterium]